MSAARTPATPDPVRVVVTGIGAVTPFGVGRNALLEGLRSGRSTARTLPAACYCSEEVFRLELAELFGRMWLCIGRESDLPKPGDFFTHELGDERILVVRGGDGIVRGWLDGKLVVDQTDVVLRSTDFPNMKFDQFLLAPYFGSGLVPHPQKLWIDELVVAKERIGTLDSR